MPESLFSADLATVSDLAARRRANTTVSEVNTAYQAAQDADDGAVRAFVVELYLEMRRTGTWADELRVIADASRYDREHPDDGLSLVDELTALQQYAAQLPAAA